MKQVGDWLLGAGTLAHTHTVSRAYESMLDGMVDNYPRLFRIRLVWNINYGGRLPASGKKDSLENIMDATGSNQRKADGLAARHLNMATSSAEALLPC